VLDLDLLISKTDETAQRLTTKKVDPGTVYAARDAVVHRRHLRKQLDDLRAEMNRGSREIGRLVAAQSPDVDTRRARLTELKQEIARLEDAYREAEQTANQLLLVLPNVPDPKAPVGSDEDSNVVVRHEGPAATPVPGARPHWEIGAELGIYDAERAAKLSGAGFAVLRGDGARLLRALVQFGLDLHRDKYEELLVPHFVRSEVMVGTGHLPKFADDMYSTRTDDFFVIPTGEVPPHRAAAGRTRRR